MGLRSFVNPALKLPHAKPPGTENGLSVENLSCAFGRQIVFEGISFSANPGEVLGIIGNNGAGKTTLTRCPYEIVKTAGVSPIAAGNFHGLAGTSAKELCRCAMDGRRNLDGKVSAHG